MKDSQPLVADHEFARFSHSFDLICHQLQLHGICTLKYFATEFLKVQKYRTDTSMKTVVSSVVLL